MTMHNAINLVCCPFGRIFTHDVVTNLRKPKTCLLKSILDKPCPLPPNPKCLNPNNRGLALSLKSQSHWSICLPPTCPISSLSRLEYLL